ncbi:cytochrome P450 [Stackebrandtia soli]|uniref:cytochrome P450 n=1 Tax=Stackebrandtia soli TaxID=1892856 RepID=UPI0039E74970
MSDSERDDVLNYPIPRPGPLDAPEEWARLRDKCPVGRISLPSGDEAALVTRYADVKNVLSDPRFGRLLDADDAARLTDGETGLFNSDMAQVIPQSGEGHQRWRRRVAKWFTAKRMRELSPRVEAMADKLVDEMTRTRQPADLKAAFGFPLPVWVICELLGVPSSDRSKFGHWSDTMLNLTRYRDDEVRAAQAQFVQYMAAHVAAKRDSPGNDLLSELAHGDDPLSDAELVATGQGLLVAGHETTANMIVKMIAMLLADRSRWDLLLNDRALVRTAVEESLRFDANAGIGMVRYLTDAVELSGGTVPRGTTVMCSMAAANRDETTFDDADIMRLDRSPNPHLAFGSGPHSCLGQALARTELQVALETLLRRLPTLDLAVPVDDLRDLDGLAVGGLETLPVTW